MLGPIVMFFTVHHAYPSSWTFWTLCGLWNWDSHVSKTFIYTACILCRLCFNFTAVSSFERRALVDAPQALVQLALRVEQRDEQIGRASCRESVCQYV